MFLFNSSCRPIREQISAEAPVTAQVLWSGSLKRWNWEWGLVHIVCFWSVWGSDGVSLEETEPPYQDTTHFLSWRKWGGSGEEGGGGGGGGRCGRRGVRPAVSLSAELLWMRHHYKLGETGRQEGGPEGGGGAGEEVRRRKEKEENKVKQEESWGTVLKKKSDGKKTWNSLTRTQSEHQINCISTVCTVNDIVGPQTSIQESLRTNGWLQR